VSELLASSVPVLGDRIKRELHQSIVEVGTRSAATSPELREDLPHPARADTQRRARRPRGRGRRHAPFSDWKEQVISPGKRYESIVEELQQLARSLLISASTCVAMPDRQATIDR
jgi:carboxylate-amine ligase